MLSKVGISNFRSLPDYTEIDFNLSEYRHWEVEDHGRLSRPFYVTFGTIKGGNATGKTSLLEAIGFLKDLVSQDAWEKRPVNLGRWYKENRNWFRKKDEPISISIEFRKKGYCFNYRVAIADCIREEILNVDGKDMFARKYDQVDFGEDVGVSDAIKGVFSRNLEGNKPVLVLGLCGVLRLTDNKCPQAAYEWFRDDLHIFKGGMGPDSLIGFCAEYGEALPYIREKLRLLFPGIQDVAVVTESLSEWLGARDDEERAREIADCKICDDEVRSLRFTLGREDGETVRCGISALSDGERKLACMLPYMYLARLSGQTVFIDDFDTCLDPFTAKILINSFDKADGQLVIAVFDLTSIVSYECFDEVWTLANEDGRRSILPLMGALKTTESQA